MESRAKLVGHPIHPMLIVLPLGLLSAAVVFDIVRIAGATGYWGRAAYYDIALGVIGGLVAAIFGLIDWLAVPRGTRARSVGLWHGLGNVTVVALFIVSWFLRQPNPDAPGTAPFVLAVIGVLLALVTGWLGGELVDRLGVGVDPGANLDAPSSLAGPTGGDQHHEFPGYPGAGEVGPHPAGGSR